MYPKHVMDSLGDLAAYLSAAPSDEELDDRGCLSKETCRDIDLMFLNEVESRLAGFNIPEGLPHGTDPNNKWRTVSCLQKAIRFSDPEMAALAAHAAHGMESTYLRRRLGVIAAEDVMIGDPFLTGVTLAMMGHQHWRKGVGELRFLVWLAVQLASAPKDRTLVDLLVLAGEDRNLDLAKAAALPVNDLLTLAERGTQPQYRQLGLWFASGTTRFGHDGLPQTPERDLGTVFSFMRAQGMTRYALWLAARVCGRLQEAMFVSVYLMDEWLRGGHPVTTVHHELPPTPKVGRLLGASYDQHTREGKKAILAFFARCDALRPYVDACPPDRRLWIKNNGVFRAEGGMLREQAVYGPDQMTLRIWELTGTGHRYQLLPPDLRHTYLDTIRANIDLLNDCRRAVLSAAQAGS